MRRKEWCAAHQMSSGFDMNFRRRRFSHLLLWKKPPDDGWNNECPFTGACMRFAGRFDRLLVARRC